jgi:hypothetical protein
MVPYEAHFLSLLLKMLSWHQKYICGSILNEDKTHMKLLLRVAEQVFRLYCLKSLVRKSIGGQTSPGADFST